MASRRTAGSALSSPAAAREERSFALAAGAARPSEAARRRMPATEHALATRIMAALSSSLARGSRTGNDGHSPVAAVSVKVQRVTIIFRPGQTEVWDIPTARRPAVAHRVTGQRSEGPQMTFRARVRRTLLQGALVTGPLAALAVA